MSELPLPPPRPGSNVPEMSVSELSSALKRTVEEGFSRVRVRGELSRVSIPASGHMYSTLKDDQSVIDLVCWKGTLARLGLRPEEGLEVVCTGRITTYPARSSYQMVVEAMELAGEGALLKMLEDRRRRLAAEGLFDPSRKRPLPFLPQVIGVVTSPTGAVIRDILHRLRERFPCRVLVWPVLVQGGDAAGQVAAAIAGFNALSVGGAVPRPDLLIVARGGGSLEDLMPFNEENVVRAAAASRIPLISAVGHETDTTLIDHAADLRAPTPTAAAEKAVPVRVDLMAQVLDDAERLVSGAGRIVSEKGLRVQGVAARLGDPARLLEPRMQRTDMSGEKLGRVFERSVTQRRSRVQALAERLVHPRALLAQTHQRLAERGGKLERALERGVTQRQARLLTIGGGLAHPRAVLERGAQRLSDLSGRLERGMPRTLERPTQALAALVRMLDSLSFERVLDRGFALVQDPETGQIVSDAGAVRAGQDLVVRMRGDGRIDVTVRTS